LVIDVSVDEVMSELRARVRARLREHLARDGNPVADDAVLFDDVERLLQSAANVAPTDRLILPELLGDPNTWRLETAMRYTSHRGAASAGAIAFVKRRLLMPVLRWLFEYSRDNFERQRRVNHVLFACVQELAVENARLRHDLRRQS
jgi:hypothetical protein